MLNFILDLIYPSFCCHCGRLGSFLCQTCFQKISFSIPPLQIPLTQKQNLTIYTTGTYEGPLKSLITAGKYRSAANAYQFMAKLIFETTIIPPANLIVPVPVDPKRARKRGYNHTLLLAKALSKESGIPYQDLLIKNKHTPTQASAKNRELRQTQLQGLFSLQPPPNQKEKASPNYDQHILLLDDVITTGATFREAYRALTDQGFNVLAGLAIAQGG